ncbi:16S rRNA (cytidine(1402)-2'-O)-methyltransferase [Virgibacillus alimentarius]|uniref:Ribosomal RNA small subunit methyltransferase I n=1 Tax=Virgibacillus alimentarius TaxID=698769 RepID=A0ABS4S6I9_9BACI|nr:MULTISPECIES: 16S rRNA (cytidine(1402)-2'-O)-methyltransferase [Virgibacillus]MBP2257114.1 16S rRNA (cytidine1402-2'-O)-methyltransferase [Virgibacillus alimentarius]HLR68825.1 16S rRNA (cytidine(1402)-2'-O)-methyltransferase [Virgibacillus sp.]
MQIQKSFDTQNVEGTLYVVPTPIGNLEDITYRALKTLRTVAVIAAEDTRNTKNLLRHFEIKTSLISYHEHNKNERNKQLLNRLKQGESIAIVSDAGMPAISDPGFELVQATIEANHSVVVLPGASAALCALVGSGLPTTEFLFYGFLPRKKKQKEKELQRLKFLPATLLFYESPYRLKGTLNVLYHQFGNRQLAVARELTKKFEEYSRGTLEEVISWADKQELKGEFCLVVEGCNNEEEQVEVLWWGHLSVKAHVEEYMESDNISSKEAIKKVATDRNIGKREVYKIYHIE